MTARFPDIQVNLKRYPKEHPVGVVRKHLCWAGISKEVQREFVQEAIAADPKDWRSVFRKWVTLK